MKRTPLFPNHQACHAKLVDFAGWEMPIQYSGVIDEYQTVRSRVWSFRRQPHGKNRRDG